MYHRIMSEFSNDIEVLIDMEIGMEEVVVTSQICLNWQRIHANLYGTMREN